MAFGERFKGLRTKAGLTQTELAKVLGVTPLTVLRYEKGQSKPKFADLILRQMKELPAGARRKRGGK